MPVGFALNIREEGGDGPCRHAHPHRERSGARLPSLGNASPASFAWLLIELFFLSLVSAVSN